MEVNNINFESCYNYMNTIQGQWRHTSQPSINPSTKQIKEPISKMPTSTTEKIKSKFRRAMHINGRQFGKFIEKTINENTTTNQQYLSTLIQTDPKIYHKTLQQLRQDLKSLGNKDLASLTQIDNMVSLIQQYCNDDNHTSIYPVSKWEKEIINSWPNIIAQKAQTIISQLTTDNLQIPIQYCNENHLTLPTIDECITLLTKQTGTIQDNIEHIKQLQSIKLCLREQELKTKNSNLQFSYIKQLAPINQLTTNKKTDTEEFVNAHEALIDAQIALYANMDTTQLQKERESAEQNSKNLNAQITELTNKLSRLNKNNTTKIDYLQKQLTTAKQEQQLQNAKNTLILQINLLRNTTKNTPDYAREYQYQAYQHDLKIQQLQSLQTKYPTNNFIQNRINYYEAQKTICTININTIKSLQNSINTKNKSPDKNQLKFYPVINKLGLSYQTPSDIASIIIQQYFVYNNDQVTQEDQEFLLNVAAYTSIYLLAQNNPDKTEYKDELKTIKNKIVPQNDPTPEQDTQHKTEQKLLDPKDFQTIENLIKFLEEIYKQHPLKDYAQTTSIQSIIQPHLDFITGNENYQNNPYVQFYKESLEYQQKQLAKKTEIQKLPPQTL